jgi:hypothetical protein
MKLQRRGAVKLRTIGATFEVSKCKAILETLH